MASGESLLGAHAVDGKLKGTRSIGRPSEFVVDQPKRAVVEQVHAVRFASKLHLAGTGIR